MSTNLRDHFLNKLNVHALLEKYGSPLYVYSESILRERLREVE
jgi:diaminopimelate decarboxylase